MKKITTSLIALFACACIFAATACAYWIWTPDTKKFINPKWAAKDSPKEQFDWAMSFYNAKDYKRAAIEFEKVTKHYEYSEYASRAQYYVGLCYENMEKFYTAFENYQKAVDNFPHIENLDEIIAREYNIGKIYASKDNPKVMGADIMAPLDRAIDIFKKVVENAPYGSLADEAQVSMAEALKRSERFDEAAGAFQKLLDDYPSSKFAERARFEVADCAYRASLKPDYDSTGTDKAIRAFRDFAQVNKDSELSKDADKTVQRLRDNMAQKSMMTAEFYEGQGQYRSAIIYYQDVIGNYPDSSFVNGAKAKIESLKAKLAQPKTSVMDLFKKEEKKSAVKTKEGISAPSPVQKKEGWSFFGLGKSKPKKEAAETGRVEAPKKKGWTPFSFIKPAKPKEATEEPEEGISEQPPEQKKEEAPQAASETVTAPSAEVEAAPASAAPAVSETAQDIQEGITEAETTKPAAETGRVEAPKKNGWTPLNFDKPSKPKEAESEGPKGMRWTPLNFTKPAKPKEDPYEIPKKKWAPLDFTREEKSKEALTETDQAQAPKKNGWVPLNFTKDTKFHWQGFR